MDDVSRGTALSTGTVEVRVDLEVSGNVTAPETVSQTGAFETMHLRDPFKTRGSCSR